MTHATESIRSSANALSAGDSLDTPAPTQAQLADAMTALDNRLSQRYIELDPAGYFLIYIDREKQVICAEQYSNDINEKGLAVDPETGEPIPCDRPVKRTPIRVFTGRTAKEIGIKITEEASPSPITRFDHALYLGREFVRAELALVSGEEYIQD
jgi:dihydropteroate synthase